MCTNGGMHAIHFFQEIICFRKPYALLVVNESFLIYNVNEVVPLFSISFFISDFLGLEDEATK